MGGGEEKVLLCIVGLVESDRMKFFFNHTYSYLSLLGSSTHTHLCMFTLLHSLSLGWLLSFYILYISTTASSFW